MQADFWVWGQSGLQNEFQDSQGYTEHRETLSQKTKKKKNSLYFHHLEAILHYILASMISDENAQ